MKTWEKDLFFASMVGYVCLDVNVQTALALGSTILFNPTCMKSFIPIKSKKN